MLRRDFLNGVAMSTAAVWSATVPPRELFAAEGAQAGTVTARWGGNARDVVDIAHRVRDGRLPPLRTVRDDVGLLDVVIVGAGLSGLAAAFEIERGSGGKLKIALLDNQHSVGGAAQPDVFDWGGRRILAAQGSIVNQVATPGLETYPDTESFLQQLVPQMDVHRVSGLERGFGVVRVDAAGGRATRHASVMEAPWRDGVRDGYFAFLGEAAGVYQGADWRGRLMALDDRSFVEHIRQRGWDPGTYEWMVPELETFFGIPDQVSAAAVLRQYGGGPPVIRSFPGGNSFLTRAMLAGLRTVPRTSATVVAVEQSVSPRRDYPPLRVVWFEGGRLRAARTRAVVMAGGAFMTKHVVRELPAAKLEALQQVVHAPVAWVNVLLRDARAHDTDGLPPLAIMGGTRASLMLAYDKLRAPTGEPPDPGRPVVLGLSLAFNAPGQPARAQAAVGRQALLDLPFGTFEGWVKSDLQLALGSAGLDVERDIVGISVCRWGHGYAYPEIGLLSGGALERARAPEGRISFAHSDLDGFSHVTGAIGHGRRAAREVLAML